MIFSKDIGLWVISEHKEFEFKCTNVTLSETRKSLKLLQIVLPSSIRKYDDLQSLEYNKILPHSHSSFYSGLKLV